MNNLTVLIVCICDVSVIEREREKTNAGHCALDEVTKVQVNGGEKKREKEMENIFHDSLDTMETGKRNDN